MFLLPLQVTTAIFLAKIGGMFKVTHVEASKCCISKPLGALTTSPDTTMGKDTLLCYFLVGYMTPYRQEINVTSTRSNTNKALSSVVGLV